MITSIKELVSILEFWIDKMMCCEKSKVGNTNGLGNWSIRQILFEESGPIFKKSKSIEKLCSIYRNYKKTLYAILAVPPLLFYLNWDGTIKADYFSTLHLLMSLYRADVNCEAHLNESRFLPRKKSYQIYSRISSWFSKYFHSYTIR